MSEARWLKADHPDHMVSALRDLVEVSEAVLVRKLRLFACACCRRIWPLLDRVGRSAVEVAERYAEGLATERELRAAHEDAYGGVAGADPEDPSLQAANAVLWATMPATSEIHLRGMAMHGADLVVLAEERVRATGLSVSAEAVIPWQCRVLLDLFGNPFRAHWLDETCLAYEGGLVRRLARGIAEQREFERLPILADALEEAGCADAVILGHCREPGEHFPGCWVVDLCLRP
jgi:hypothetical protein